MPHEVDAGAADLGQRRWIHATMICSIPWQRHGSTGHDKWDDHKQCPKNLKVNSFDQVGTSFHI